MANENEVAKTSFYGIIPINIVVCDSSINLSSQRIVSLAVTTLGLL